MDGQRQRQAPGAAERSLEPVVGLRCDETRQAMRSAAVLDQLAAFAVCRTTVERIATTSNATASRTLRILTPWTLRSGGAHWPC